MGTYTAGQIIRASGVSYRQLDRWARIGALVPSIRQASGSGAKKERLYSEEDLRAFVVLGRLRTWTTSGVPAEVVRAVAEGVRAGLTEVSVKVGPVDVVIPLQPEEPAA